MKTRNKPHYLLMAAIVAVFAAATWSCNKDDDPSLAELREDKLKYLEDSLRIADSLGRLNQSGIVNYAISVVNGSSSTLHKNSSGAGREGQTQGLDGAVVTISQYGKTETLTTDATGMVVFRGFFRTSVNVNVTKSGFTTADYVIVTSTRNATENNTVSFVGNILPLFETTGANAATITGRATIQSNLTNKTRELVPDGTKITASIDAKNANFGTRFLTTGITNLPSGSLTTSGLLILYAGEIVDAAYSALATGTVTGGNYSITVPAAVDGLPVRLEYSEVAADQTLFENLSAGQRTIVNRTVFNDNSSGSAPLAALPTSSSVTVSFESFKLGSPATANAVISANTGVIDRLNITDGGTGYVGTPIVEITGGGGTGAAATATVGSNGRVTGLTLTNVGAGYTSTPTVTIVSGGTTGTANATQDVNNQQVYSIAVTAGGSGYTSAPTVSFTGGGTGTGAAATATISGGRVIAVQVTAQGSGYNAAPTVVFTGGGGTGATATASMGSAILQVNVTAGGTNHVYAPTVIFPDPAFKNGTRAQGVAIVDVATRTILGVQVTNVGSGYTAAQFPLNVTFSGGSGATAESFLAGGSVISADMTANGEDYAYAPRVEFVGGNGTGAAGTAIMSGGRVVGVNITSGGTGYTSNPTINFIVGSGAVAYATITNGAISAFTVTDGGSNFNGVPRVVISGDGGGATATAVVSGGQITGITVGNGGSGYLEGNFPAAAERFSAVKGVTFDAKPGISYVNDVYYGTGTVRNPN